MKRAKQIKKANLKIERHFYRVQSQALTGKHRNTDIIQALIELGQITPRDLTHITREQVLAVLLSWGRQHCTSFTGQKYPVSVKRTKKASYRTQSDLFLASWEWRTLRYEVLKLHDRRCMCCGATPDDKVTVLHVDHIKPRHTHPELALDSTNLQVLCSVCNQGKGAWDTTDYRHAVNDSDWTDITLAHAANSRQ